MTAAAVKLTEKLLLWFETLKQISAWFAQGVKTTRMFSLLLCTDACVNIEIQEHQTFFQTCLINYFSGQIKATFTGLKIRYSLQIQYNSVCVWRLISNKTFQFQVAKQVFLCYGEVCLHKFIFQLQTAPVSTYIGHNSSVTKFIGPLSKVFVYVQSLCKKNKNWYQQIYRHWIFSGYQEDEFSLYFLIPLKEKQSQFILFLRDYRVDICTI